MTREEDTRRVAEFFRSDSGKAYRRFGRYWELPRYIREYLEPFNFFEGADPIELEKLVQRMAHIIRSRAAKKAWAWRTGMAVMSLMRRPWMSTANAAGRRRAPWQVVHRCGRI